MEDDTNELRELGVTYISISWFEDERYGFGQFRLEETGDTFYEIRPASFSQVNEEVKKVIRGLRKKRYWLWDVGNPPPDGIVFKSSAYLNEDGQTTNGIDLYEKEQLLKKHESEFVDIEES